jgi:hypothetical protein
MLRARRVRQCRHYDQEEVSREKRKLMMAVLFRSFLLLEAPACASQSFVLHDCVVGRWLGLDFGWPDWMTTAKSRQDCLHLLDKKPR